MREANVIILSKDPDLVIEDIGPWNEYLTITNDAENVVKRLIDAGCLPEGKKLFYYNSEGSLDEIVVQNGKFVGIKFTDKKGKYENIRRFNRP